MPFGTIHLLDDIILNKTATLLALHCNFFFPDKNNNSFGLVTIRLLVIIVTVIFKYTFQTFLFSDEEDGQSDDDKVSKIGNKK